MKRTLSTLSNVPQLGTPIPNSPHSVSVSMPLWEHAIGYEEGDSEIIEALQSGYPRFVFHPFVAKLFCRAEEKFATPEEFCFVFSSLSSAKRCLEFVWDKIEVKGRIEAEESLFVTVFKKKAFDVAKSYWQHSGEIISSRQAQAALENEKSLFVCQKSSKQKRILKERIASFVGEGSCPEEIFLFPSGMASIFQMFGVLQKEGQKEGLLKKTIQLGFPYLDTLKIQEKWGSGVFFFPKINEKAWSDLEILLKDKKASAVFCEFPGNPLLNSIDLPRLSSLLKKYQVPFILDDSINGFGNHTLLPYVDVLVSSLTKYFSGRGNVMGGVLVFNKKSPFYLRWKKLWEYEDVLWEEDAILLEQNSRDFLNRLKKINQTTEQLCDFLKTHPKVEQVYYPKFNNPQFYKVCLKKEGGYGGVFSLLLKKPARSTSLFYDSLEIKKGPSFGMNWTLACPYTLLAHYHELEWAESFGISRYLIRVSVGLENVEELIQNKRNLIFF